MFCDLEVNFNKKDVRLQVNMQIKEGGMYS